MVLILFSPSRYLIANFQITTYEFSPSSSVWHYRITPSDEYYTVPLQITVFLWKNQNRMELQNCSKLRIPLTVTCEEIDSFLPQKITSHWRDATPTMWWMAWRACRFFVLVCMWSCLAFRGMGNYRWRGCCAFYLPVTNCLVWTHEKIIECIAATPDIIWTMGSNK